MVGLAATRDTKVLGYHCFKEKELISARSLHHLNVGDGRFHYQLPSFLSFCNKSHLFNFYVKVVTISPAVWRIPNNFFYWTDNTRQFCFLSCQTMQMSCLHGKSPSVKMSAKSSAGDSILVASVPTIFEGEKPKSGYFLFAENQKIHKYLESN